MHGRIANMTMPGSPYSQFPAQPIPSAPMLGPRGKVRLRGRRLLRLSLIFLILGVAAFAVGIVIGVSKSLDKVDNFKRVAAVADGSQTVDLTHTGKYVVYFESSSIVDHPTAVELIEIRLTPTSGGAAITPSTAYGDLSGNKIRILTYNRDGHRGVAMWQFDVTQTGTYKVQSNPSADVPSDGMLAFGPDIAGGVVAGGLLILLGVLLLITALILFIIGLVRRSGHKNQLKTMAIYQGAGYGPPGGFPPPGFAPGGYAPAGFSPPGFGPAGFPPPVPGTGFQPGYQQPYGPPTQAPPQQPPFEQSFHQAYQQAYPPPPAQPASEPPTYQAYQPPVGEPPTYQTYEPPATEPPTVHRPTVEPPSANPPEYPPYQPPAP